MSKQTPNHQEPQASAATVAKAAVSLREVTASPVRAVTDLRQRPPSSRSGAS